MNSALNRGNNLPVLTDAVRSHWMWSVCLLVCAVCCGCQKSLLQNVNETPVLTTLKEKVAPQIPPELEGLNAYLSQDLWIRNHHWSAYNEWKTLRELESSTVLSPPEIHRWLFGVEKQDNPLLVDNDSTTNSKTDATKKQKTKPTTDSESPTNISAVKTSQKTTDNQQDTWSFDALQEFFARHDSESERPLTSGKISALKELTAHNTLAGWNAAIIWATLSPQIATETIPILETLVCDAHQKPDTSQMPQEESDQKSDSDKPAVSPAMRQAALNGLSLVLAHADALPLQTKKRLTQLLTRPDISLKLREELYCSLARFMPPAQIPTLDQSLDITDHTSLPPKSLRRAALESCILHGLWFYVDPEQFTHVKSETKLPQAYTPAAWPENIMQIRWDADANIRGNFGYWAALVRHPDAEAILTSQLKDADLMVQNKAIANLGLLNSESALQTLKAQSTRPQANARVAAATGLSTWGAQYLSTLRTDSSSAVRLAVAEGLGRTPSADAALMLKSLISDRSTEVQLAVIDSISSWPDELAVPLLLEGILEGVFKTRRSSVLRLVERTGVGGSISIEASREERNTAVQKLVQSGELPGGFWTQLMQKGIHQKTPINQGRLAEIQAYFQNLINHPRESAEYQHALQELSHLTPDEVSTLEKLILETSIAIPEEIYTELLPELDKNYEALNKLTSSHVSDRRQAAQQLFLSSQNASLNPVVVRRLRKLMASEQDRLVWRIVMEAVARDSYEETAQLALLAINHNWPDIRILGCDHFGSHGSPQYAPWILPLLKDKNISVQLAALKALGQCHNPVAISGIQNTGASEEASPSLRGLMTHSNQRIRFQSVVALSRLGDFEGMQELVRLSKDPSNTVRKDAVREMGNSGQTRFVEPLIKLAWTERNISTLKETLNSLGKLVPESEQPSELKLETDHTAQAKIWMNWWQTQHSGTGSQLFTDS